MNDDFKRKMREIDSRMKHEANQELMDLRWWYYELPADRRSEFKQQVQALADLSERFSLDWSMFVKVRFSWTQHSDEGEVIFDAGGNRPPQEILAAFAHWDESEQFFTSEQAEE